MSPRPVARHELPQLAPPLRAATVAAERAGRADAAARRRRRGVRCGRAARRLGKPGER